MKVAPKLSKKKPDRRRLILLGLNTLAGALLLTACSSSPSRPDGQRNQIRILDYSNFLPQAMTYELVGNCWYQWDPCGHEEDPNYVCNIKVVIYDGISLDEVKARYPVVKDKVDYRYVQRDAAIAFIKDKILENENAELKDENSADFKASMAERLKKMLRLVESLDQ